MNPPVCLLRRCPYLGGIFAQSSMDVNAVNMHNFILPFTCIFGPGQSKVFASKPGHLLCTISTLRPWTRGGPKINLCYWNLKPVISNLIHDNFIKDTSWAYELNFLKLPVLSSCTNPSKPSPLVHGLKGYTRVADVDIIFFGTMGTSWDS